MTTDEKVEQLREFIEENSQAVRALKDSLTVEAHLNTARERQYSQAFLEHQEWLKGLDHRVDNLLTATNRLVTVGENHEAKFSEHETRMAELDARLDRIAALIERFLQGREGNGAGGQ